LAATLQPQEKAWEDFVKEIKGNPTVYSDEICNKGRLPPMEGKPIPKQIKPIIVSCLANKPEDRPSFSELVDRLIDATISYFLEIDPHSVQFWKAHKSIWDSYNKTEFEKFKKAFKTYLNIEDSDEHSHRITWNLLKERLVQRDGHVTLASFEKVLYWFGPLKSDDGDNLFTRLRKFITTNGFSFQINVTGQSADKMLLHEDRGSFFIRLNEGGNCPIKEAPWTLSVKTKKKVHHFRVALENGVISVKGAVKFQLSNANITSLFQLVKQLRADHPKDFALPVKIEASGFY